jgi:hypothetical protein
MATKVDRWVIIKVEMKLWQTLLLISLLMALPTAGACSTDSDTQLNPAPSSDVPYLSPEEAISIAQEHSITSPLNVYEKQASVYAKQGGTQGWNATYTGNGKWTVELRLRHEDESLTIHRWSVFESNLTAVYVGAFASE